MIVCYLVVVCGVSEETTKGDGISDAAQIDEEHSGDGLDVESLVEIAGQERKFPLYVQVQATAETKTATHSMVRILYTKVQSRKFFCEFTWKSHKFA